jgi:hypothetical protein
MTDHESRIIYLQAWELSGAVCDLVITIDVFRFVNFHDFIFTSGQDIIQTK